MDSKLGMFSYPKLKFIHINSHIAEILNTNFYFVHPNAAWEGGSNEISTV